MEQRREARAREGWKGGVLVERRFFWTRSRWSREVNKDWGGLRRRILVGIEAADLDVSTADGIKEGGVERGAKSARDIGSEGGVCKIRDRGNGGADREGSDRW